MPLPLLEPKDNLADAFLKFNTGAEKPFLQFFHFLMRNEESPLSIGQRELIAAFVSGINECSYCHGSHTAVAARFGIDAGLLKDLLDDLNAADYDPQFKTLLAYARKLTLTPSRMDQDDIDQVLQAGWSERALYDAILVCGAFNFMNRFVDGLGLVTYPENFEISAERLAGGYNYLEDKLRG